ncbi:MAG: hypothetical protein GXO21_05400 [Aquificae bacterium]|nr:hypothetical protein [Aquificota bacterium]
MSLKNLFDFVSDLKKEEEFEIEFQEIQKLSDEILNRKKIYVFSKKEISLPIKKELPSLSSEDFLFVQTELGIHAVDQTVSKGYCLDLETGEIVECDGTEDSEVFVWWIEAETDTHEKKQKKVSEINILQTDGYKRELVDFLELVEISKKIKRGVRGSNFVKDFINKFVYIDKDSVLDNGLTAGEMAMQFLKRHNIKGRIYSTVEREKQFLHKNTQPIYYNSKWVADWLTIGNRFREFDLIYLDIKSAYWQLANRVGFDVYFWRSSNEAEFVFERGRKRGYEKDEIAEWKLARNSIIGILAKTEFDLIENGQIIKKEKRIRNVGLYAALNYILDGIFTLIWKKFGDRLLYVNTDGCIIHGWEGREFIERLFEILGLEYRMIVGYGQVLGYGAYMVRSVDGKEQKKTKLYEKFQTYRKDQILQINERRNLKKLGNENVNLWLRMLIGRNIRRKIKEIKKMLKE